MHNPVTHMPRTIHLKSDNLGIGAAYHMISNGQMYSEANISHS